MIQAFGENKQLDSKVCGEEEGAWTRGSDRRQVLGEFRRYVPGQQIALGGAEGDEGHEGEEVALVRWLKLAECLQKSYFRNPAEILYKISCRNPI